MPKTRGGKKSAATGLDANPWVKAGPDRRKEVPFRGRQGSLAGVLWGEG